MTADKQKRADAVSESIGFLLIFTMVIVGIGLVTQYGYPMLHQQQTSADEQIMEKNMIVLQNDMKSLAYKTIPYTETSLKIGGGTLTVYNASNDASTVRIYYGGTSPYDASFKLGDLRYESITADRILSIQDGAVITRNMIESGSSMLAEPRWFYDGPTNTWVVNLISINSTNNMSRAGIGDVQMGLGQTYYNMSIADPGVQIWLDYTPDPGNDCSIAWNNYLVSSLHLLPPTGTTTKTYQLNVDPSRPSVLIIKKVDIIIYSV